MDLIEYFDSINLKQAIDIIRRMITAGKIGISKVSAYATISQTLAKIAGK